MPPALRKVLIIEDETDLRRAYGRYFGTRYRLAFAATGAEALQQLQNFAPEVVVLDMHLPDIDGLDVLRRIREYDGTLPVVITTAYMSMEPLVEVLGMGHSGYLVKPFSLDQLAALIDGAA